MFEGYEIYVSDRKNKKYAAKEKNKNKYIHFGDKRYQHYYDKFGFYKHLDHKDSKRKEAYYLRHKKNYGKGSADYFSKKILW